MKTKTPSGDARSGLPRPRLFDSTFFSPPSPVCRKTEGGMSREREGGKGHPRPPLTKAIVLFFSFLFCILMRFPSCTMCSTQRYMRRQRSGVDCITLCIGGRRKNPPSRPLVYTPACGGGVFLLISLSALPSTSSILLLLSSSACQKNLLRMCAARCTTTAPKAAFICLRVGYCGLVPLLKPPRPSYLLHFSFAAAAICVSVS